jgi:Spy/CpxP family protein refolding chaperone
MKKIATLAGIMALVGALAVPAWAHGPGWGRGPYGQAGPGYCAYYGGASGGWGGNLTSEQREQLDKLYQKFFDQTAQLRSELWAKRSELNVQLNTTKPDAEKVMALQKDISDLQAKMAQERIIMALEARKISPEAGFGRGVGPMWGGYGPGMGYGMHGAGYGPGMRYGMYRGGYGPGMGYGMHGAGYGPGMRYGMYRGGYGPGMGYGMYRGGYGPGMGYGMYGAGYGPGSCWY